MEATCTLCNIQIVVEFSLVYLVCHRLQQLEKQKKEKKEKEKKRKNLYSLTGIW